MTTPSVPIQQNHLLAPLTSWRIGGPAAYFAEPGTPEELEECLLFAEKMALPVFALGGGSNLLISDTGFPGLVVRYRGRDCTQTAPAATVELSVGAGHSLSILARRTALQGLAGLEWAEGIPGVIGGAVVGNAGAHGGSMAEVVEAVEILTLETGRAWIPAKDCRFSYRSSRFSGQMPGQLFVLSAALRLRREDPAELRRRLEEHALLRRSRTPVGFSSGSVFKNPPGDSAGRLIERAGLKGAERGAAQISPAHANYIVNRGGATAEDVRALMALAQEEVWSQFGVRLEAEVRMIGF